ncbi:MAG: class II fructose-bisphosphate aldolase [Propionibacteriaceae bacterium]|jgi:fructose-bisphosphate aldolase class II/tagatose 1,6-diphosphate aldolase GatY/KbaY|nr:class II fructose-bisphosphate aldolase [Propionibacteriaceae bacterium]
MTVVRMQDLLAGARAARRGLGSFNVTLLESAEALVAAAETVRAPMVLQISQNAVDYHGTLAPLALGCLELAARASVPVVVHLDHADRLELVGEAFDMGIRSVMFDGSALEYADNVATTAQVVAAAHRLDAAVEAELGEVGGKDGVHAAGVRTDPDDARAFVAATGVDSLAVAVGSSHAKLERDLQLDHALIARLAAAVPVPLVLHGSSSVADAELTRAIASGMTKINISTHLNKQFTAAVRAVLAADETLADPRKYVKAGRAAMAAETARLLEVLGEAGAAA